MVHAVGLRTAQRVKAADLLQRSELLFDGIRDAVLRQQFADRAVLTFGAGAIVPEDVDDDGVVADAEAVEFVDDLAGLDVDMFDEAGKDFHQSPLKRPLRLGNTVPARHVRRARREPGVGRNPAELLLAREHALAIGVPTVVELAFVLVGPLLEDLVRSVSGARRPVKEERFVGRERLVMSQPVDAMLREIFA